MTILPSIDIFEKYISNIRDKAFSDINAIFFNENIDFLLTSNYLDFLEMHFGENEIIRALIVELSDTNRSSPNPIDNLEDSIYETLYLDNCDNIDCLFAITFNDKLNIEHYRYTEQNKIDKIKNFYFLNY